MDRAEAMIILKDLVAEALVDPSYVSIGERIPKHIPNQYQIQIKCDYNKTQIEQYAKKYGLTITEDKERKYLVIYKP